MGLARTPISQRYNPKSRADKCRASCQVCHPREAGVQVLRVALVHELRGKGSKLLTFGQELIEGTRSNDRALIQQVNAVAAADRGEPMRHQHDGLSTSQV